MPHRRPRLAKVTVDVEWDKSRIDQDVDGPWREALVSMLVQQGRFNALQYRTLTHAIRTPRGATSAVSEPSQAGATALEGRGRMG
jgi:hypothetical protein